MGQPLDCHVVKQTVSMPQVFYQQSIHSRSKNVYASHPGLGQTERDNLRPCGADLQSRFALTWKVAWNFDFSRKENTWALPPCICWQSPHGLGNNLVYGFLGQSSNRRPCLLHPWPLQWKQCCSGFQRRDNFLADLSLISISFSLFLCLRFGMLVSIRFTITWFQTSLLLHV